MKKIFFQSGNETIVGNLLLPENVHNSRGLLILHGAGASSKERFTPLQQVLLENSIASLAIDFRGVGESTGSFESGSLQNRLSDAQAGFDELTKYVNSRQISVFGSSMGGYVAVLIAKKNAARSIILSAAAAYDPQAEDVLLNKSFTKIITKPQSWKHSKSFDALKKYNGKVLVIYGEKDTIIPDEIKKRYQALIELKGKYLTIPNEGHNLLSSQTFFSEIVSFLKEN